MRLWVGKFTVDQAAEVTLLLIIVVVASKEYTSDLS